MDGKSEPLCQELSAEAESFVSGLSSTGMVCLVANGSQNGLVANDLQVGDGMMTKT
jgi:hypothetical protein